LPVKLETQSDRKIASPIYGKSSMMTILSDGDGYVHISSLKEGIYKGEKVKVFLF
jgi:molybdopterin molybdotransferase